MSLARRGLTANFFWPPRPTFPPPFPQTCGGGGLGLPSGTGLAEGHDFCCSMALDSQNRLCIYAHLSYIRVNLYV